MRSVKSSVPSYLAKARCGVRHIRQDAVAGSVGSARRWKEMIELAVLGTVDESRYFVTRIKQPDLRVCRVDQFDHAIARCDELDRTVDLGGRRVIGRFGPGMFHVSFRSAAVHQVVVLAALCC